MRIKKVTSLLGVLLVLSVGLMAVKAAEQTDLQQDSKTQTQAEQQVPESEKAKYKPISDVRHVVPPYDSQDKTNTKNTEDVDLDSSMLPSEDVKSAGSSVKLADGSEKDASAEQENEKNVSETIETQEASQTAAAEPVKESPENENIAPVMVVPQDAAQNVTVEPAKENIENEKPMSDASVPQETVTEKTAQPVSTEDAVQQSEPENSNITPAAAELQAEVKKTESGYQAVKNKLWCITFQLVWNTFMDKVTHGPVLLAGGNPPVANELNKKLYTADLLNEDSYYTTYGKISKSLKRKIERAIEKKFNETSDILDTINWGAKNSYLFYAMLKKDFNFETPFDKLTSAPFNGGAEKVKYFGVNKDSERKLRKNVYVLFYNSPDEYAVRLSTKEKEDVILYRTDKKDSFEDLYLYVTQQDVSEKFSRDDSLMVPNFKIDKTISYDELCGKKIKGTNNIITQALQTIKFNMDNKGGTLKSEAALAIMRMSLAPEVGRKYHFDKEFVMFLKEEGKDKPYFAVRVENTEFLDKE